MNPAKATEAVIEIEDWPSHKRVSYAIKGFFYCLGLAIVSIFIPVLHFVLVPLFVSLSPIVVINYLGKSTTILGGTGICPECESKVNLHPCKADWPIKVVCEENYHHLKMQPKGTVYQG